MTLIPASLVSELAATKASSGFRFFEATTDVDPLSIVRAGAHLFADAVFFSTPDGDRIGGLGVAWRTDSAGAGRFSDVAGAIDELGLPAEIQMLFGFGFSDDGPTGDHWAGFNAVDVVLPVVTVTGAPDAPTRIRIALAPGTDTAGICNILRSLRVAPDPATPDLGDHVIESHPHVSEWCDGVSEAVGAIHADLFDKVVLSRSVVVRSTLHADGFDLVQHLAGAYPGCHAFAWATGDATFVGASPELLLEVREDGVRTNPLAGSAARGEGEIEDRAIGESLMASVKDRSEHALVVEDVSDRLRRHTDALVVPAAPSLRRVATVQHLSTEITGDLRPGERILDLVADLHPTPAVGGTPRHEASRFIEKTERIDRGWYTGGIGWVDAGGNGLVALALRCGLVRGNTARLYAGAGIVADSNPDEELAETRLKLRPLLELLAAT